MIILIALIVGWLLWRAHQGRLAAERKRGAQEMHQWYATRLALAIREHLRRQREALP